jgi:hypothetical protein
MFAPYAFMSTTTTGLASMGRTSRRYWAVVQREEIAARAFAIYAGRTSVNQAGSPLGDWLQAERELWRERITGLRGIALRAKTNDVGSRG